MRSAQRIVMVAAWLIAGAGVAVAQGDRTEVTGVLSDPAGAHLTGVEIVLSGIDVHGTYTARTDGEGRYDFPRIAPGGYRVTVRRPDLVPVVDVLAVKAGQRLMWDIGTTLKMQIALAVRAVSADALRRWVSGGPRPAGPPEWECTSSGGPCAALSREAGARREGAVASAEVVMPSLVQPPPVEFASDAIVALKGRAGTVQMRGLIGADGLPSGLIVSSATSPDLATGALTAVRQMRWDPARLRGVPVATSMTMEIGF